MRDIVASSYHSLGVHQIDVSQAEEREVGGSTVGCRVGSRLAVVLQVGPLSEEIAVLLVGEVGDILLLSFGEEHIAVVLVAISELGCQIAA